MKGGLVVGRLERKPEHSDLSLTMFFFEWTILLFYLTILLFVIFLCHFVLITIFLSVGFICL